MKLIKKQQGTFELGLAIWLALSILALATIEGFLAHNSVHADATSEAGYIRVNTAQDLAQGIDWMTAD